MNSQSLLRDAINEEIRKRKKTDRRYGQRALARETGIGRVALSEFLRNKRLIRRKTATRYFQNFIPPEKWKLILEEFEREESASESVKYRPVFSLNSGKVVLNQDEYEYHSDPTIVATLYLFELEDYHPSVSWMCKKMGLEEDKIRRNLEILFRLDLIEKTENFYLRTGSRAKTSDTIPNAALNEFRRRLFPYISKALDLPNSERDFYNWTCAIDPQDLPEFRKEVRKLIRQFERKQLVSSNRRIYNFMTALFPLSK